MFERALADCTGNDIHACCMFETCYSRMELNEPKLLASFACALGV